MCVCLWIVPPHASGRVLCSISIERAIYTPWPLGEDVWKIICITPFKRDTQDLWETSHLLGTWSPKHSVVGQARWRHPCESIVSLGYVVMYIITTQARHCPANSQIQLVFPLHGLETKQNIIVFVSITLATDSKLTKKASAYRESNLSRVHIPSDVHICLVLNRIHAPSIHAIIKLSVQLNHKNDYFMIYSLHLKTRRIATTVSNVTYWHKSIFSDTVVFPLDARWRDHLNGNRF